MFSKRELEGYLLIDHSAGDGITQEQARQGPTGTIPVPAGKKFEGPWFKCGHCFPNSRIVVMNPNRTRDRGYCPKCDRYVCDECETTRVLTGECRTNKRALDDWWDRVSKGDANDGA